MILTSSIFSAVRSQRVDGEYAERWQTTLPQNASVLAYRGRLAPSLS